MPPTDGLAHLEGKAVHCMYKKYAMAVSAEGYPCCARAEGS